MELKVIHLTKIYSAGIKALDNFSYTFTPGVYGLLGPNGAGKSTLMNIITDNITATSGEIFMNGEDISKMGRNFRKILGYMPQQQGVYPNFSLIRFMYYMAALKGIKNPNKEIEKLLRLVNLSEHKQKRLGGFSGGMKQRALIAQAMLGSPEIIILDEPTAGLDPKERIRIRNLISEVAMNKIVIIATHVVSDIEFIAKEVLLLNKGAVLDSGTPHELCRKLTGKVFTLCTEKSEIDRINRKFKVGNISKDDKNVFIRVIAAEPPKEYDFIEAVPDLEDLYLSYFGE